jgi:hypothetical protein
MKMDSENTSPLDKALTTGWAGYLDFKLCLLLITKEQDASRMPKPGTSHNIIARTLRLLLQTYKVDIYLTLPSGGDLN